MKPIYETPRLLSEYLFFHYGADADWLSHPVLPREALNFAVRTVREMLPAAPNVGPALDLGCAVGRSSFELSRTFAAVVGLDYSQSFVNAAERLRLGETISYQRYEEGHHFTTLAALAPADAHPERIQFAQGDALNLPADLGDFALVHAANLLCRLTHPQRLLERLHELVQPGGHLVLTTPCTWLEDFTPSEHWPRGSTLEWLQSALEAAFVLEETKDLPFLIREHARKFQLSVAQATRWRRV